MTRPLLSVVIPSWNRSRLVCDAVQSALVQRTGQVEVIVVDDASTDDTAEELTGRFGSLIRLLRLPDRRGAGAARNAGVAVASGEYLAFLDSDDVWLPGKFDAELRAFEWFPDAEAVVSDNMTILEGRPSDQSWFATNGLFAATQGQICWLKECPWLWTNWHNTLAMCSITVRRGALTRIGHPLFSEDLTSGEDWEFELRLYGSCKVAVLPEVWAHVRRYDDSTRLGRPVPGKPRTESEELAVLRDVFKVMERAPCISGAGADLALEFERCRSDVAGKLARFTRAGQ
jgi:glycosyltransferase involved in cell wall biosynthesis